MTRNLHHSTHRKTRTGGAYNKQRIDFSDHARSESPAHKSITRPPKTPKKMHRSNKLFTIADVLGLHKQLGALVIDGKLFRLSREKVGRDEPEFTELYGSRRRVEVDESVEALFYKKLHNQSDAIDAFRARCMRVTYNPRKQLLEELKNRVIKHDCLRFVIDKLIPHLREINGHHTRVDRRQELGSFKPLDGDLDRLAELDHTPSNLIANVLGTNMLLLGQSAYHIDWVNGNLRPRTCFLQAEGERYSVNTTQKQNLMHLENTFAKKLQNTLRGNIYERENEWLLAQAQRLENDLAHISEAAKTGRVIYQDRERSVVIGPDGTLYCCQEIPPFVLECSDRKLRFFDRVQMGIKIASLSTEDLIWEGAYIMSAYNHMFICSSDESGHLCMGDKLPFLQRFKNLPLEQTIVEYLNAARLIVCAGNFDLGNGCGPGGYHNDTGLDRPIISSQKAKNKGYPIYRYHRTEMN